MDKIIVVLQVEAAGAENDTVTAALAEAEQAFKGKGLTVEKAEVVVAESRFKGMEEMFSKPEEAEPTIPYQAQAKLQADVSGTMLDVIGNDGRVLCSFSSEEAKRAAWNLR